MKRIAMFVAGATLAAIAMAAGLPENATVAVMNDAGRLVGTGSVHTGTLEIELAVPSAEFVTLQVSDAAGHVTVVQGVVALDGSLHLVGPGGIEPAASFASENALAFELHTQSTVEARRGDAATRSFEEPSEAGLEATD